MAFLILIFKTFSLVKQKITSIKGVMYIFHNKNNKIRSVQILFITSSRERLFVLLLQNIKEELLF